MPTRRYAYGIIRTDDEVLFDLNGVDGQHEVYTVGEGGLAVVTSAIDDDGFQALDRAEALRYLAAHQRVLEQVQHDFPVLPIKFGTVLADEAQLRALLRRGAARFDEALATCAGSQQYEVVVLWNVAQVFQAIAADPQIVALKARLAGLPPDEVMQGKLLLGRLVHEALQAQRAAVAGAVLAGLADLAADTLENPVMDDSMVCNTALLIAHARSRELDERLEQLDARFGGGLQIRCVGPLPPYSFTTLEVQRPGAEAVAAAREHLGLPEATSFAALKGAYRRLAARAHPDHNPDQVGAAAEMEQLTAAYKLLVAVAQAQAPAEDAADWPCHFDHAAAEGTLMIAVRRQEVAPVRDEG